ncbi:MAG: hypothetical protein QOE51_3692 [Actinoplanes sp.]|nr:hypothetical protein [Actinoplanes sp.]
MPEVTCITAVLDAGRGRERTSEIPFTLEPVGTDDEPQRADSAVPERQRLPETRERAADVRDQHADARERAADRREFDANAREAAADERERRLDEEAGLQGSRRTDPMGRFHDSVGRSAARTERSNSFLGRSREAVQRGVDRLDRLRGGGVIAEDVSADD